MTQAEAIAMMLGGGGQYHRDKRGRRDKHGREFHRAAIQFKGHSVHLAILRQRRLSAGTIFPMGPLWWIWVSGGTSA